jgi:hypothetical protein
MVQEQNEQQTKQQILDNGTIFNIILALVCFRALVLGLQSKMVQGTKPFWVRFGLFVYFFFRDFLGSQRQGQGALTETASDKAHPLAEGALHGSPVSSVCEDSDPPHPLHDVAPAAAEEGGEGKEVESMSVPTDQDVRIAEGVDLEAQDVRTASASASPAKQAAAEHLSSAALVAGTEDTDAPQLLPVNLEEFGSDTIDSANMTPRGAEESGLKGHSTDSCTKSSEALSANEVTGQAVKDANHVYPLHYHMSEGRDGTESKTTIEKLPSYRRITLAPVSTDVLQSSKLWGSSHLNRRETHVTDRLLSAAGASQILPTIIVCCISMVGCTQ